MKLVMKLSLIALSLLLTQNVLADSTTHAIPMTKPSNGFYIGGDIGVGTTNCDNCNFSLSDDSVSTESSNNGATTNAVMAL